LPHGLLMDVHQLLLLCTPTLQAYTAAIAAQQHCPHNAKAWLRMADACKVAGRWQLAQLCYSTAVDELGLSDEAVTVSRQQPGPGACYLCDAWQAECWTAGEKSSCVYRILDCMRILLSQWHTWLMRHRPA
jgi:hypothetical protein